MKRETTSAEGQPLFGRTLLEIMETLRKHAEVLRKYDVEDQPETLDHLADEIGAAVLVSPSHIEERISALSDEVATLKRERSDLTRRLDAVLAMTSTPYHGDTHAVLADASLLRPAIYGLIDPREPGRIRYVGQARAPVARYFGHLNAPAVAVGSWLKRLSTDGQAMCMVLLEYVPCGTRQALDERESAWIADLKGSGQADLNSDTGSQGRFGKERVA